MACFGNCIGEVGHLAFKGVELGCEGDGLLVEFFVEGVLAVEVVDLDGVEEVFGEDVLAEGVEDGGFEFEAWDGSEGMVAAAFGGGAGVGLVVGAVALFGGLASEG